MRKLLIIAMVLAFAASASAGSIWSDDFDSYVTGSSLTSPSQGGWEGWDGLATSAIASDDTAVSAPNSAKLWQNDDVVREYSGVTSGSGVYIAWQYIPSTHQGEAVETYFIIMNKYTLAIKGWSIQIGFNLADGSIHDDQSPGDETGTGGTWYNPLDANHEKALAAVDLWADLGGDPVYYDNLSLSVGGPAGPGDVDGNGVVDGLDLTAVMSAWETIPGDLLWNPAADLDGNNVVNGLDLTAVISNWTVAAAAAPEAAASDTGEKPGRGNVNKGKGKAK
jgi:hypothetical protein